MSNFNKQVSFERNKLLRTLAKDGRIFQFKKFAVNEYNEPTSEEIAVATIQGIYHDTFGGYSTQTTQDGSKTVRELLPMILVSLEEAAVLDNSCFVEIDGVRYDVISIKDPNNMGYAGDISLKVVI